MKEILQTAARDLQSVQPLKKVCVAVFSATVITALPVHMACATTFTNWLTVVNNAYTVPSVSGTTAAGSSSGSAGKKAGTGTNDAFFFSYNQPSVNDAGTVVFRARAKASDGASKGGPISGIFTRDMSDADVDAPIIAVAVRGGEVPAPNNISKPGPATFNEFPSFPRIDASSDTLAFRGQSNPSYVTTVNGVETRSGTSGLYATLDTSLTTGIRNINAEGALFQEYKVPGTNIRFEQYPGAPSPTSNIVTFKGNWTDADGNSQTGVYYRDLTAENGKASVVKIAERGEAIPIAAVPEGMTAPTFGSTAPPSAAAGKMVFTGLDNEEAPTAGGIFMANLEKDAQLTTVAGFNTPVPHQTDSTLNTFGEGLSFDGRYVGFWARWGTETFQKTVTCGSDGNSDLLAECRAGSGNDKGEYTFDVVKNQGIFLADTEEKTLFLVAQAGEGQLYEDFLYWNYSGKPSSAGESSDEGDEAEGPRWRSSAFLAVDGDDVVFKGLKQSGESGLYGALDVTDQFDYDDLLTILTIGMDGGLLDPMAQGLPIVSLGLERDGFRNGQLAISASMTDGEASWAGIYVDPPPVPEPSTILLFGTGLAGLAAVGRRKTR